MLKANKLRAQLNAAVPWLKQNPDNLWVGIRKGTLVSTGEPSAAFEYRYQLEILILDYPGDMDFLSAVILAWARVHQPDLIFNPDKRAREISFMADILSNRCADILYSMPTDEAVIVSTNERGETVFIHRDEPDYAELMGVSHTAWDLDFSATMDGMPDDESNE